MVGRRKGGALDGVVSRLVSCGIGGGLGILESFAPGGRFEKVGRRKGGALDGVVSRLVS